MSCWSPGVDAGADESGRPSLPEAMRLSGNAPPSVYLAEGGARNYSEKGGFKAWHVFPSAYRHKGLSFRPVRLNPILGLVMTILVVAALGGCSRKAENLVGAGRVIRGPGGLGKTTQEAPIPDRATHVVPGTADFGDRLHIGIHPPFSWRTIMGD